MTEQTKTITFEGQQYDVSVWVNWVARDADGSIFGYGEKPFIHDGEWTYHNYGETFCIVNVDNGWRFSCIQV